MDWKTEAIDKLKQYEAKRESLEIIPKQISEIDLTMTSIRSARVDGAPVKGGGSGREDLMLSCIVQKASCAAAWSVLGCGWRSSIGGWLFWILMSG